MSPGYYCIHTGPDAGALDLVDDTYAETPEANIALDLALPLFSNRRLCSAEIPCEPGYGRALRDTMIYLYIFRLH